MKKQLTSAQHTVVLKAVNEERQIVYGVVYEPNVIDTHGDMMLAHDIEAMAHRFLSDLVLSKSIDTMHDNDATSCYPVESYIARKGDPDYPEGAWVLGVKVVDADIWSRIKKGELNGYSFEARVTKSPVVVEIEYDPSIFGETELAEGHTHFYWLKIDDHGIVIGGRTSRAKDGHYHEIVSGTATEMSLNHQHRILWS